MLYRPSPSIIILFNNMKNPTLSEIILFFFFPLLSHSFQVVTVQRQTQRSQVKVGSFSCSSSSTTSSLASTSGSSSSEAPQSGKLHHVVFEYCKGCRWMAKAIWMTQELLTTFNDDNLSAVSLVPHEPPPGARFVVTHYFDNKDGSSVLWHREKDGDFPAMKVLKQLVRDKIDPEIYLGHSDTEERNVGATSGKDEEPSANDISAAGEKLLPKVLEEVPKPNVAIKYCTGCRWMLRSAYLATELLTTFDTEIKSVTLVPSRPPEQGGIFTVTLDGETIIWDRKVDGGFPEPKDLKRIIRDKIAPSKKLGHSDYDHIDSVLPDMDDDEAEEMRAYFGVL